MRGNPWREGSIIVVAAVGWAAYIIIKGFREPTAWNDWGFRTEGLMAATGAASAVFVIAGSLLIAWGAAIHGLAKAIQSPPTFWLAMAIYPLWGLVQQFLLNAIVARTLAKRLPAAATVVISSLLFAALHLPDRTLASLTGIAALVWVPIFLKWRNVWPLAVCHGWLGAITYYAVFQRDVLAEVLPL